MTAAAISLGILALVVVTLASFVLGFIFGAMLISAGMKVERKRPDLRVVK